MVLYLTLLQAHQHPQDLVLYGEREVVVVMRMVGCLCFWVGCQVLGCQVLVCYCPAAAVLLGIVAAVPAAWPEIVGFPSFVAAQTEVVNRIS
jgi:hypothetical protein